MKSATSGAHMLAEGIPPPKRMTKKRRGAVAPPRISRRGCTASGCAQQRCKIAMSASMAPCTSLQVQTIFIMLKTWASAKSPGHPVQQKCGEYSSFGCGSKRGTTNGTLLTGKKDYNLRSPGGLILTHTHIMQLKRQMMSTAVRLSCNHYSSYNNHTRKYMC